MISVSFVSVLLPLHTLVTTMCGVASKTYQGGVTPIDSIVTAATAGQSFDRFFSAV